MGHEAGSTLLVIIGYNFSRLFRLKVYKPGPTKSLTLEV